MEVIRNQSERALLHPLEAFQEHQDLVSQELNRLAQGHVEKSGGMLTLLEPNTEIHEAQRVTQPFVDSTPVSLEEVEETAKIAEPHFGEMLDTLNQVEEESQEISRIAEDLLAGQNIILITNHGKIQDIAIALAAYHVAIRKVMSPIGDMAESPLTFKTNIMLSKMISHIGFYGAPAVDILGKMCDRQYFSFPRTESIQSSSISNFLVKRYNEVLRTHVTKFRLGEGGNIFAIAPSGTVDKPLPNADDDSTRIMAPVARGTRKILMAKHTKVLPVAMWLEQDEEFVFEPLGFARKMKTEEDVHQAMESLAEVLNINLAQTNHEYRRPLE